MTGRGPDRMTAMVTGNPPLTVTTSGESTTGYSEITSPTSAFTATEVPAAPYA